VTVELSAARDRKFFVDNLQAAFRRDDGSEKFRREELLKFFDKAGAILLDIVVKKKIIGGAVLIINAETRHNRLSLFFVDAAYRNLGVGSAAWQAIEKLFPDTEVWYASTPWLDRRNLHFYLNKCGFVAFSIYGEEDVYLALEKVMR